MTKVTILFPAVLLFSSSSLIPRQTSPIFQEVRAGKTEAIKERIRNCENCAEKDENGNTPLHVAAQEGQTEIVDILTTEPDCSGLGNWLYSFFYAVTLPNKNEQNNDGNTPLHCAIESGHTGAAECLLQKKANTEILNNENIPAAFSAIKRDNPELIPLLIKYSLIQQKRNNGDTMLHYALKENKRRTAERLAEIPVIVEERNNEGKTPAIVATDINNLDGLELLKKKGVNLNAPGRYGCRPIHNATMRGNYEAVRYLLEHNIFVDSTDVDGNTPLHIAVMNNKENVMNLLLSHKADVTRRNKQGKDIFSFAVQHKHYNLMQRLKEHPGVDINARDNNGQTAFMRAAATQDHESMNNLLSLDAHIDILDNNLENALHKVARNGDEAGLQLIIKNNPQLLTGTNNNGDSPLFIALQNGRLKVAKLLIYYGASLQTSNKNGETALHQASKSKNVDLLREILQNSKKPTIEGRDNNGLTALHYAAAYDNVDGMKELITHGASPMSCAHNGDTIAHTAAASGALHSLKLCQNYDPYMQLKRNKNNETPFLIAVKKGSVEAAEFLLCDNDYISRDFGVAMQFARTSGHGNMITFLEQKDTQLLEKCRKINRQPDDIEKMLESMDSIHKELLPEDTWHFIQYAQFQPKAVKRYSVDDLYHMPEAERARISLENTKYLNELSQEKMKLEQKLHSLKMKAATEKQKEIRRQEAERTRIQEQQERERITKERIHREQEAELKIFNAQHNELNRIKEQHVELERIAQEKEKAELDAIKKQEEELKKINEQKKALDEIAQQKKIQDEIAQQKKELDHYAAQKAVTDAAKHAQALEEQQAYVPFNLQASAPPMEEPVVSSQCAACNTNKVPAKPLPCVKCKKKIEGICVQCIKEHKGRCPQCWQLKCLSCKKKGVTMIPCENCQKIYSSARICSHCLGKWIEKNEELKLPNRCPGCLNNTLNEELVQKILSQK